MLDLIEVYRTLETQLDSYEERALDELVSPRTVASEAEVHTKRGKVQAVRDLRRIVRNSLAYDPDTL